MIDQRVFYHFTSVLHIRGIVNDGIALGLTPILIDGRLQFLYAQQWLTSNKTFNQSWCEGDSLPYDRTAFRVAVKIPESERGNLLNYGLWRAKLGGAMLPDFDRCPGVESWFVYEGIIPPDWIIDLKPKDPIQWRELVD